MYRTVVGGAPSATKKETEPVAASSVAPVALTHAPLVPARASKSSVCRLEPAAPAGLDDPHSHKHLGQPRASSPSLQGKAGAQ